MISSILGLPFAPVMGVIRLGELIQEQAEHALRDPAAVRRRLEEIDEAREAGLISEEEHATQMEQVLQRMMSR
ncbi:gas vesicle protein GvpG [Microtetraspora sp. NBRC 13810]|uniref:gas vesicle protein GvpG n=1 Tax=Microtetraspora sp. NBRC 13810 TaxID=3030990 RepID=UPI0025549A13|nr:gas vesicle protein GvpG [Microtetraspora sp. NBRC 13810]